MKSYLCKFIGLFLIHVGVSQPPPESSWKTWESDLKKTHFFELLEMGSNFTNQLTALCNRASTSAEFVNGCVDYYSTVAKKQGSVVGANLLLVSIEVVPCKSLDIITDNGKKISIEFDQQDNPRQIAQELADFLEITASDYLVDMLNQTVRAANTECSGSKLRRERTFHAEQLSQKHELKANKEIMSSSMRCVYPNADHEWLIDKSAGFLPLGSCEFTNLYVYNDKWYYVSDSVTALHDDILNQGVRLNTLSRENKDGPPFRPTRMSTQELHGLLQDKASGNLMELSLKVISILYAL